MKSRCWHWRSFGAEAGVVEGFAEARELRDERAKLIEIKAKPIGGQEADGRT
jgi:hypothetical protein